MGPKILVVQPGYLGDVVLTTPLFRAIKRVVPDAHLAALVTEQAGALLEGDPHLDLLLLHDKRGGERLSDVARKVRRLHFDQLLSAHRSHRSSLLALLSRVPRRVGFADAGSPWAFHVRIGGVFPPHEADRNLSLLKALGGEPIEGDRVLHVGYTEDERERIEEVLGAAGVGVAEPVVGLCPGAVLPSRRWPSAHFVTLGRALLREGLRPVVLGGPAEAGLCRRTWEAIGGDAILSAGNTPLKALAAWMDRLSLLVTTDDVPLHVAAARGTPTVALLGSSASESVDGPYHASARVVAAEVACRPCSRNGTKRCREGNYRCMTEIEPERVLRHCLDLLGGRS